MLVLNSKGRQAVVFKGRVVRTEAKPRKKSVSRAGVTVTHPFLRELGYPRCTCQGKEQRKDKQLLGKQRL